MGSYSEYLNMNMDFEAMNKERKRLLSEISRIRDGSDILVMASDQMKNGNSAIDYSDILPFQDQLSNLSGSKIDIILETPGGFAEVVEDLVRIVRQKYSHVSVIIPGYSKSAGTIFAMAANEILMGSTSALGPIDAQIASNGKRYSADAFLDGLKEIKKEAERNGRLNLAMIPILQNISPGEIQNCENAQKFSQKLVKQWLIEYKFNEWTEHRSTGISVTNEERAAAAERIASRLGKHSDWLTHGRSIKIEDFKAMKLDITDYTENPELDEVITRYYTLMRMTFESTNIYKIFETVNSQIFRFTLDGNGQIPSPPPIQRNEIAVIEFQCPRCKVNSKIQANIGTNSPLQADHKPYPIKDNVFICPNCGLPSNILPIKMQLEAQSGKKVVS